MNLKVTILGCGASLGVPAAGNFWGECDPSNPKNERTRASILVQSDTTNILVDMTVDLRIHLNRTRIQRLDGVLITHEHSDHINGSDDLRTICYTNNRLIDLYGNQSTLGEIERRWPYVFRPKHEGYREFLKAHIIGGYDCFRIGDIDIQSFEQDHTSCTSLGFRFGKIAYSVDVADLSDRAIEALKGVDVWIVDAGGYHASQVRMHANLERVRRWADIIKPKITYLTVLTTKMDYNRLCDELPPHIRPAYDGLVIAPGTNYG